MASTLIEGFEFDPSPWSQKYAILLVGTRLYELMQDGSNLRLQYTDDLSGLGSWSGVVVKAQASRYGTMCYDSANSRIEIFYAGGNSGNEPLSHRAVTANLTSGTPTLSAEITIEAGGTALGCNNVTCCIAASRIWVSYTRYTAATTREVRVVWTNIGSGADTVGNWTGDILTNIGSSSENRSKASVIRRIFPSGSERILLAWTQGAAPSTIKGIVFDPSVASGSVATTVSSATVNTLVTFGSSHSTGDLEASGNTTLGLNCTSSGNILMSVLDETAGTIGIYYSSSGSSFTAATNSGFTGGRSALTNDGTNHYIFYSATFGATNTDQVLDRRKIDWGSHTVDSSGTTVSDGNGNGIQATETFTGTVYFVYKQGTSSGNYSVRADKVTLGPVTNNATLTTTQGQNTTQKRTVNKVLVA